MLTEYIENFGSSFRLFVSRGSLPLAPCRHVHFATEFWVLLFFNWRVSDSNGFRGMTDNTPVRPTVMTSKKKT